ncbi:type II secretion system minor pseudopilin GspK [Vibrio maerlii]|uniref:type II secretion system minor pseudopilin GspK n=1 Tax=Vibrio maerlii TaxID=2231648 RepID=UPI000E3DFE53|nr:type II secretion system minor pseudopilin GspK [Vibrio maerlii]
MGRLYSRVLNVRKQTGAALLVVLLLLAIMAAIAATMSERLFSQFTRATHQVNYQQAYWYAMGVEALAKVGIRESYEDADTINMSQVWAIEEQVYPLDYGTAIGRIDDAQACFNLNALSGNLTTTGNSSRPEVVELFRVMLEEVDVEPFQAEVIADSLWEFTDENNTVQSSTGVEDATYESFSPAYMTANQMLADESELRAIYQVSGEVMTKLRPLICALPSTDLAINVNTLAEHQAPILSALFTPELSVDNAKDIIAGRPFDGWESVEEFLQEASIASLGSGVRDQAQPYLAVDSAYFELDAKIEVGDSLVRIRSLLHSEDRENLTVLRRRFGGIGERISDRSN